MHSSNRTSKFVDSYLEASAKQFVKTSALIRARKALTKKTKEIVTSKRFRCIFPLKTLV